jgi:hypothetical protein
VTNYGSTVKVPGNGSGIGRLSQEEISHTELLQKADELVTRTWGCPGLDALGTMVECLRKKG